MDQRDLTTGEAAAWRAGWAAAREAIAATMDCGCVHAAEVTTVPPNSARRWEMCGQPNCAALDAATIRAMEPPA